MKYFQVKNAGTGRYYTVESPTAGFPHAQAVVLFPTFAEAKQAARRLGWDWVVVRSSLDVR